MSSNHRHLIGRILDQYDQIVLRPWGSVVADEKPDGSTVTRIDCEASEFVVATLKQFTPEFGIISEEAVEPYLAQADWQWVIDPLDGTAAYARGLPVWGLGIGLLYKGEPQEGYLRFPVLGETYAYRDGRGLLNERDVQSLPDATVEDTRNIMITAIHTYMDVRLLEGFRLHNLGSNLYHMISLAMGRCEAIITGPCYIWDLAAALPFCRAQGFVERFLDGTPLSLPTMLNTGDFGFRTKQPLIIGPADQVQNVLRRFA